MNALIRLAESNDNGTIVELLNKVTLNLHEKGINQWVYPWNPDEIEFDIEKGLIYVLLSDDMIAGTFSIKDTDNMDTGLIEPDNKYLYRIAILPEFQGKNLGKEIVKFALNYSAKMDKSLYLDCWSGNRKLRDFYSGAGFNLCGIVPENDYTVCVFKSN